MTESNEELLKLVSENRSLNEIAKEVNLSSRQAYIRILQLMRKGFQISSKYYDDGEIEYNLQKNYQEKTPDEVEIHMRNKNMPLKAMVISDIHYGHKYADIEYMYRIYEYCIKNNIGIIINVGDLVEGIKRNNDNNYKNSYEALIDFSNKYPYEKNIINYVLFGNHDYYSLELDGLDIYKFLENYRPDLIPVGYASGKIKINEDGIRLRHNIKEFKHKNIINNEPIILVGHSHRTRIQFKENIVIHVPTLSNVRPYNYEGDIVPGALELEIEMDKNNFGKVHIKHLLVEPKVLTANELEYHIPQKKQLTLSKNKNKYF